MKATVYVLFGGLKHYRPPKEGETVFYWDPKKKLLYPLESSLEGFSEYDVVDSNITTGKSVEDVVRDLNLPRDKVKVCGNPLTRVAEKIVDEQFSNANPDPEKIMLAFSGKPGSLKTFLAKGLAISHGMPLLQVGKELQKVADVGKYGEVLAEKEKVNPFTVGELLYPILAEYDSRVVIVDGIKSPETLFFLSYSTRRPFFLFIVEQDEMLRRKSIILRSDPDDKYDVERDRLFESGLNRLREHAYAIVDMSDWRTLQPLTHLLSLLGYRTGKIVDVPNPFGSKLPILELYKRNVMKLVAKKTVVEEDFSSQSFHRSYVERLREHGINVSGEREKAILLTASAFRIIDDILDENTVRNMSPAFWRVHGITESVYIATLMTVKAYSICNRLGVGKQFLEMFEKVVDAVAYELLVEDGREENIGFDSWLRAAEREAAFREFLATLAGCPEKGSEFRAWGLKAQAKDDLLGSTKGGREDTEKKLNRILFKPEWAPLLDQTIKSITSSLSRECPGNV